MAVVAILVTLVVQVLGAFVGQAKESATKVTISKIQGLLSSRQQAFDRLMKRRGYLQTTPEYLQASGYNEPIRSILAIKLLEIKYFPQRYPEVNTGLQLNFTKVSAATSGEILYDFLTQSNVLGDTPIGVDAFSPSEARDVDNNGLPEFYDAWGNPLRFYRWPTRLFRSGGEVLTPDPNDSTKNRWTGSPITTTDVANAKILFTTLPSTMYLGSLSYDLARDPDDPLGLCENIPNPNGNPENLNFEALPPPGFHTPSTYHVMLVVSAGPDGQLGLYEPDDLANYGHLAAVSNQDALADNIVYLNVRAGGK